MSRVLNREPGRAGRLAAPLVQAGRVVDWAHRLGAVVLVLMLLMVLAGILAREAASVSLGYTDELAAYALVALTFLGVPVAFRDNRSMFRVALIHARLRDRTRAAVDLVWHLAGLGVMLVLVYQFFRQVRSVYVKGTIATTSTDMPLWIPQSLMPLGALLLTFVVLGAAGSAARRLMGGSDG